MTPIDDLKPGQFLVICGHKPEEREYCAPYSLEWFSGPRPVQQPDFNGRPLRLLEVCLPFLCVTDGKDRFAVDVRRWDVQRVTRRYAQAMMPTDAARRASVLVKARKKKQKPDPRACPRCGERMAERLVMSVQGRGWFLICTQCGHDSGPVKKPS